VSHSCSKRYRKVSHSPIPGSTNRAHSPIPGGTNRAHSPKPGGTTPGGTPTAGYTTRRYTYSGIHQPGYLSGIYHPGTWAAYTTRYWQVLHTTRVRTGATYHRVPERLIHPGTWEAYTPGYTLGMGHTRVYLRDGTHPGTPWWAILHPGIHGGLYYTLGIPLTYTPWVYPPPSMPGAVRLWCDWSRCVRRGEALGSTLRLIWEREPLCALKSLILLGLKDNSAHWYSALPVGYSRKIG